MDPNPSKNLRTVVIVFIALLLGYYIGVNKVSFDWQNNKPSLNIVSKEPPAGASPLDLSLFWTVVSKVNANYYDKSKINTQKMVNGAISGMLTSLDDPYTIYLPPVQNTNFKQGMAGEFSGIGAELGMKGKDIVVISPLDGSPAQKAGIKAGDIIIKIAGQPTLGWTLQQAVEKIRGPRQTPIALTVVHKDTQKPIDLNITRDTITVKSVDGWIKSAKDIENIKIIQNPDSKVLYVRLSQFGDNTNKDWLALINKLVLDQKKVGDVKGFILDLRNNPGGYLTDAQYIASEFIKDGVIVTQDSGTGDVQKLSVMRPGLITDMPVIVLINKGSASAAEIVAGALRDHGRAKLVGETSFGKGTVQEAEDLGNGAGIHITIAKWLTPNGTWVHGKGLTPDISVKLDEKDQAHDTQLEKAVQELIQ